MHERAQKCMDGRFGADETLCFAYFIGISALLGIVFALVQKDDSGGQGYAVVQIQWLLQTLLPTCLILFLHARMRRSFIFKRMASWWKLLFSGLLGAALFSPFGLFIDVWLAGEPAPGSPIHLFSALSEELTGSGPPIVICWAALNLPLIFGCRSRRAGNDGEKRSGTVNCAKNQSTGNEKKDDSTTGRQSPENSRFLSMLPPEVRGEPIYLKSESHYLRVVTRKGNALILYNLKDAIRELPVESGVKPHRSYWVSKNHISRFKPIGRQGELHLTDGSVIPVSRANAALFKNDEKTRLN